MNGETRVLIPLARRAAAGDLGALEQLLIVLYPAIRSYQQRWMTRHREAWATPEDLAQDAMCRIAQAIAECRAETPEQLLAWAICVARNVGLDHLRARRRDLVAQAQELTRFVAEVPLSEPPQPSRLDLLLRREYERLPAESQEIVWRRVVEGATWREIAEDVGNTLRGTQRRFQRFQATVRNAARRAAPEWHESTPG